MKRLAKKLGEGVPVHLVFPSTIEPDEDEDVIESPMSSASSASSYGQSSSEESVCSWDSRDAMLWEKQTSTRSKFATPARTSAVVTGRYVVHYREVEGTHGKGEETFGGLGYRFFAPIPEE